MQGQGNFEAIRVIWIHKYRIGKQIKTRIEKKENFDSIQITMKEKITYTGVTLSASLFSFLHENLLSSQFHENKNYIKKTKT